MSITDEPGARGRYDHDNSRRKMSRRRREAAKGKKRAFLPDFHVLERKMLLSAPPTVATGAASSITLTGATLNATVNPNGSTTTALFQYSTSPLFTPTVATTIGSGYNQPVGVAVDAVGDVFVSDIGTNSVYEVLPSGMIKTIGSGFNTPRGVAVDASGDVFVADYGNNAVKEVLPNGTIKTIGSGFNGPYGVAVDTAGDVYVADFNNNAVKEVLPSGTIKTIGSGISAPRGVAVDAAGDVFVATYVNSAVYEVLPSGTINTIGSGFNQPRGVAVDAAGDVFVADSGNLAVYEVQPNGTINTIGSGYAFPAGVAVDAAGDVFVADRDNVRVDKFSPPTVTATPSSLTGTTATAVSATLTGLTSQTTYYDRVVATNAGGTVAASAGSFFTLPPPTVATGAASSITNAGATLNATVNPNGSTTTALFQYSTSPTFTPTVSTTIGSGFTSPTGVALNAAGDVFVADEGNQEVYEVLTNGTVLTIGSGFSTPADVAVNTVGDVFVADLGHNAIKEVLPNGTILTIGSGFNAPQGVAVDAAGDVFVADTGNSAVKEVLPNGTIRTIGSGFNQPRSVAVDAAGDVFVADFGTNAVYEVLPGGTINTIGSGFSTPTGVTVNAAGDVFVADRGNLAVKEVLPNGTINTIGSGWGIPRDVALDAAGDVFVADKGNQQVVELSPPKAAATPSPLNGTTATAVSAALAGLIPGITYYDRVVATSAGGTVADTSTGSFTTPQAPKTFIVTSAADSGTNTLRQAILNSNATPGSNTIDFNIPGTGVQTISLRSALPSITVPVDIDGTSQPGYTDTPLIDLDGTSAGVGTSGLDFEAGSGGSEVVGLAINNFNQDGILFASAGNTVQSSYIGTNAVGTAAGSQPMTYGVVVTAANNTIGGLTATPGTGPGNVISGSSNSGVAISGTSSTGNLVEGNLVGTNASGTSAVPNTDYGVVVFGAPTGNTIGGTAAGSRNVVSGNGIVGVLLTGTGTSGNLVEGNYIGTTAAGTAALGNADYGVLINGGADDNWVGVNSVDGPENGGQGNIIAGNGLYGVNLDGSGTSGNVIAGNLIGLNVDSHGNVIDGLGDGFAGVILTDGASGNWIGVNSAAGPGTENALQRNVISGSYIGVAIYDTGTTGNVVAGNYIGTDPSGTTAVPNPTYDAPLTWGVVIAVGASSNLIGTSGQDGANDALERNVISGNTEAGVYIYEFQGAQGRRPREMSSPAITSARTRPAQPRSGITLVCSSRSGPRTTGWE